MMQTMKQFTETAPWFMAYLSVAVTEGCDRKQAQQRGLIGLVITLRISV